MSGDRLRTEDCRADLSVGLPLNRLPAGVDVVSWCGGLPSLRVCGTGIARSSFIAVDSGGLSSTVRWHGTLPLPGVFGGPGTGLEAHNSELPFGSRGDCQPNKGLAWFPACFF